MSSKIPYSYTVLRYVHDPVTGEFINVGVVMHVPSTRQVLVRTRQSMGRAKDVFPDLNRSAFLASLRSVRTGMSSVSRELADNNMFEKSRNASDLAKLALPSDDSSLQWSQPGGGMTADVDSTFSRLFERHVTKYDSHQRQRKSDDDVWRPVRDRIAEKKLQVEFVEKTVQGTTDEISFSNAWKNGRWHAYEPISLDLADANGIKDKARKWRGHLDAVANDEIKSNLSLNLVVGKPQVGDLMPAYFKALEILKASDLHPSIYEEDEVDALVSDLEQEVRSHQF